MMALGQRKLAQLAMIGPERAQSRPIMATSRPAPLDGFPAPKATSPVMTMRLRPVVALTKYCIGGASRQKAKGYGW